MRTLYAIGALLLIVLGIAVLTGWFTGSERLLCGHDGWPAAPANGALAFIACGAALLGQAYRNRGWAALGLVPAAIGVVSLLQFNYGVTFGFDEWLLAHRLDTGPYPGRIAPALACALIVAGFAITSLVFARTLRLRPLLLALVGSLVAATGFSALIGYIAGLASATTLGFSLPIPALLAGGLVVLGATIVHLGVLDRPRDEQRARWVPVPTIVGCATTTLIFWLGLQQKESQFRTSTLELNANNLAFAISAELETQIKALSRIAARETYGEDYPERLRENDALAITRDFPAISYVAWLGTDLKTRRLVPAVGNETSLGLDHGADPMRRTALERLRSEHTVAVSGPVSPPKGPRVFMIYVPVLNGDRIIAILASEVRYREFLEALDRRLQLTPRYDFGVAALNIPVHGDVPLTTLDSSSERVDLWYNIMGQRVRIVLSRVAEPGTRPWLNLPNVVLVAGLGLSALLGLVVNLAQAARHRQLLAEQVNRRIEEENHERRRVEAKLKLSEERLKLALDSSQVGTFDWNVATGHVHFSPGVWHLLGFPPGAMAPAMRSWDSLIHADHRPRVRRDFSTHGGAETAFSEAEYRVRTRSGEWIWVLERARCVRYETGGRPVRVTGTFQDITARKQAEEALRASQSETRKLAIVAGITDNLVVIADAQGRVEWVNESFSRLLGYSLGEVAGRPAVEFLDSPDADPAQRPQIHHAFTGRLPYTSEIVVNSRRGRRFFLHLEVQPAANEQGELEKYIAVLYDITARIETEQHLRLAKSQAEAATRAKSEFLASMSHEIRTPMNGVIGIARLLLESPLNHEQRDWVRTIQSSGDALLTIINDILDFSKIESGRMEIEARPFVLADCIEEALELFALPAGNKGVELAYCIDEPVAPLVVGDITRLRQVLVNLVGNAVKFTPKGRITVTVRPGAAADELRFTVADTGIGIPADRIDSLFQPFIQVDSSTTRRFGGTGLGLAICKRLVELMGGEISLTSQVDVGTTFAFTILAPGSKPPAGAADIAPPPRPARAALVVEAEPVAQRFLVQQLEHAGFACQVCSTRAAALDVVNPLVELAVVNATLPDGAGLELATALRQRGLPAVAPVILLTLAGQTPGPDRLAAAGVRLAVPKPLRRRIVHERLDEAFTPVMVRTSPPPVAAHAAPAEEPPPSTGARIADRIPLAVLLAEDNPVNKKVALRLLERLGYRAETAANGAEALQAVTARRFHLVFMDVQMPEMDGLEATRRIRASVAPGHQPVIVALTANALAGDADRCKAAGMNDYVSKPVRPEDIHNVIVRHFGQDSGLPLL